LDVLSFGSLVALDEIEVDRLTFFERLVSFALDGGVVDEHVLARRFVVDETETLSVVEPLHFAGGHTDAYQVDGWGWWQNEGSETGSSLHGICASDSSLGLDGVLAL
jgi:hypothetical protein